MAVVGRFTRNQWLTGAFVGCAFAGVLAGPALDGHPNAIGAYFIVFGVVWTMKMWSSLRAPDEFARIARARGRWLSSAVRRDPNSQEARYWLDDEASSQRAIVKWICLPAGPLIAGLGVGVIVSGILGTT